MKGPAPTEAQPQQQPVAPPNMPAAPGNAVSGNRPGVDLGADPIMGVYLDEAAREAHPQGQMAGNASHWFADPNNYHPFNKVTWHKDDCFPVSRRAYDKSGQQVTDTARMCYKETGGTFIADGSHKNRVRNGRRRPALAVLRRAAIFLNCPVIIRRPWSVSAAVAHERVFE